MNNQVPEERKEPVTKTLAIVGFVAIVIFIVWLAVQIVSLIPGAFSSLASIADSVYNPDNNKEMVVSTQNSVVNAGESFNVSWTEMRGDGTYSFMYECTDGVAVDIRKGSGGVTSIACDTTYDLGDATSIDVLITSEKERFTDIPYFITYEREGAESIVSTKIITIVNASIPVATAIAEEEETAEPETTTEPEGEVAGETTTETPAAPTPQTPIAGEPTVVKKYIYQIPVSDPNGKIDLQVTHIGTGILNNGIFVPTATIDKDMNGAIRFEIKNIGTKTAEDWSYEATLPSDITHTSGDQKELKPNERVVITLGFEGISRTGYDTIGAEVTAKGDVNKANNSYTWTVSIVK